MTDAIQISCDGYALPPDVVTQTLGFVARKGAGKSYTAGVLAEGLLDRHAQVVVLDPVGIWWGLRLAADGESPGFDIPVIGGAHGDVPLEVGAGALIANLIVDETLSAVIDVSGFRKNQRKQFITEFAEQLFHRKKTVRTPVHLILEEAQMFAPQRAGRGEERMLGAIEDIVRLGRNYGIGATLISQRPQSVNKEVLNQVECLFLLQLVGPHERKAIDAWVVEKSIDVSAMVDELPSLPVGTAFIWSPQWLDHIGKHEIVAKKSYDASATPTFDMGQPAAPRRLEAVELAALTEAMADTIERAEANDPKILQKRIRELEAKLAHAESGQLDDATAARLREEGAEQARSKLEQEYAAHRQTLDEIRELVARPLLEVESQEPPPRKAPPAKKVQAKLRPVRERARFLSPDQSGGNGAGADLTGPQRRILNALAWYETIGQRSVKRAPLAYVAGYSAGSGGFNNPLGALRSAGLVDYPGNGAVALTDEGRVVAEYPSTPPTSSDLHRMVLAKLDGPGRKIANLLFEAYPDSIDRTELADRSGYTPGSGGFNNPLGRLRTLGVAEYPSSGVVRATDDMFLESH